MDESAILRGENIKCREENIKCKEENIKLREENKYLSKVEDELKELKNKNDQLNERLQKFLIDSNDKFQKVLHDSNNDIKESKNELMQLCGKQIEFANTITKDSNKITSSAMNLLGFLQKQCPNAEPVREFTKENYGYSFIMNKEFIYELINSHDNGIIGEFIGKIINVAFLKDKKEDQSVFATDVVRYSFSIKESVDGNGEKHRWVLDKGANKVTKLMIDPLCCYIVKELKLHLQKENNKVIRSGDLKPEGYIEYDEDELNHIKNSPFNKRVIIIEEKKELSDSEDSEYSSDSDSSDEGWRSPEDRKRRKEESNKVDDDDFMMKIVGKKNTVDDDKSKKLVKVLINNVQVQIKDPNKYFRDLPLKEREAIIKESTKIADIIRDIENGVVTKDILKFVTKFYQLDKSYFEQ